jgi:hypothetical protein
MDSKLALMYRNELLSDKDDYLWKAQMHLQDGVTQIDDRIIESRLTILEDEDFSIEQAKNFCREMKDDIIQHISHLFDLATEDTYLDLESGYTPEDTMRLAQLKSEYRWIFFDDDEFVTDDFKNDTADVTPSSDILIAYYVLLLKVVYKK